jgi:hypothetical protein
VYKIFGSKKVLLSALVDVTVAGDDEPVPLAERQFVADIQALPGARAKLARYAAHLADTHARHATVMVALAGAATADPDAAAIWRKNLDERRQAMTMFAAELAATGELTVDVETAVDVLWLAMDVRNYDWLVRERGCRRSFSGGTSTRSPRRYSDGRQWSRPTRGEEDRCRCPPTCAIRSPPRWPVGAGSPACGPRRPRWPRCSPMWPRTCSTPAMPRFWRR